MPVSTIRLPGYDLARALAVMGMVLVNFSSLMEVGTFFPAWLGTAVNFVYGRAAVVFVMLAGLSVAMLTGGRKPPDAIRTLRLRLLKRSVLLLIAGMILWHWWEADILHFYAVFITVGAGVATWRQDNLGLLTAVVLCISLPVSASLTCACDLGEPVFSVMPDRPELMFLLDILTSQYYPVFPWLGFFLGGMLLGRLEPSSPCFYRRLGLVGATACLTVEIASAALIGRLEAGGGDIEGIWWVAFLRSEAFPVTPLFILSAGASALALIGLCRSVDQDLLRKTRWLRAFAAYGRLSLTMYIAHIGWGLLIKHRLPEPVAGFTSRELFLSAGLFNLAGILFAAGWCRHFQRGPLESIFHRLVRGKALAGALPADRAGESA